MSAALVVLSLLFAVLPLCFFLWLVWWLDRYDREPVWLVGLSFGWGGFGGVIFALIGSSILMLPIEMVASPEVADGIGATLIAPLVEEPGKALILLLIVFSRHFDNTTDGFVYGAAAGLGFGVTENFMYFTSVGDSGDIDAWVGTVVVRTLYSAMMHASATSVVGAGLGFAKFRGWGVRLTVPAICLAIAMGIHALWNGLLTAEGAVGAGGLLAGLDFVLFPMEFLFLFIVFQGCLWSESTMIKRELAGEVPEAHVLFLSSFLKRNRKSWLPKGVPHEQYVVAATTLAFRKFQSRASKSKFYDEEVVRLRGEVQELLARAA
ncbi:MAG: PrsW family intramembrane metalloprotease [Proteobacteria bacterium]|nr:PrsW family intramembrane metalloprotease [Pseudomonadota bacterium]MCP4917083.1 PrsW family intramembrane metalloprotease [Pseudomonadota bacterium]